MARIAIVFLCFLEHYLWPLFFSSEASNSFCSTTSPEIPVLGWPYMSQSLRISSVQKTAASLCQIPSSKRCRDTNSITNCATTVLQSCARATFIKSIHLLTVSWCVFPLTMLCTSWLRTLMHWYWKWHPSVCGSLGRHTDGWVCRTRNVTLVLLIEIQKLGCLEWYGFLAHL